MISNYSTIKKNFAAKEVVPLLASISPIIAIYIYGSVAERRARRDSDIDLLIVCSDKMLHAARWQANWRLWRAGLRGNVSVGVVVTQSAFKPETFRVNKKDRYAKVWFRGLKQCYKKNSSSIRNYLIIKLLNYLAKIFFTVRFWLDQRKTYPAPHIKFSDDVFFHFGDALSRKPHLKYLLWYN